MKERGDARDSHCFPFFPVKITKMREERVVDDGDGDFWERVGGGVENEEKEVEVEVEEEEERAKITFRSTSIARRRLICKKKNKNPALLRTKTMATPQRVLYWGSGSAPAWRVMIALAEKKLVRRNKEKEKKERSMA